MTQQYGVSPEVFVANLRQRADGDDGRAMLAALRRGLGKTIGESAETHRYVAWAIGEHESAWSERCKYLIATLFGLHSEPASPEHANDNLGATIARLAAKPGVSPESVERRFTALLAADADQLAEHLRHAISLLKSHEIATPWARLLRDIEFWNREDHRVQRAWAQAFWRRTPGGAQDPVDRPNTAVKPAVE